LLAFPELLLNLIGLKLHRGEFRAVAKAWPAGIFGLV
jgi:hypothetical protein